MKCHTVTGYQTTVTFCLIGDLAGFNIPCNYKITSSSVFTAKKSDFSKSNYKEFIG